MPPHSPTRPAHPLRRIGGAVAAAALLVGLVAGPATALITLAGNPLPDQAPTLEGVREALTARDDGALFLTVLAVVGWLAWASFSVSLLVEAYARLTRRAVPALPGLRWQQRLAAGLLAAIAAATVAPGVASAEAALVDPHPVTVTTSSPVGVAVADAAPSTADAVFEASAEVVHVVERGEGLLDLQERYGVSWRRIAEANYGRAQPDGGALQRGQSRIYAGWQLLIPTSGTPPASAPVAHLGPAAEPEGPPAPRQELSTPNEQPVYEVVEGDWMWHIAERYLGDPQRYPEIAELNPEHAERHGDYPDHIEPGWALRLPADAADRGPIPHATGSATPAPPDTGQPEPPRADPPPASTIPTPDSTLDTSPEQAPDEPATAEPTHPSETAADASAEASVETPPGASEVETPPAQGVAGFGDAAIPAPADDPETGPAAADPGEADPDPTADPDEGLERFVPAAGFATAGLLAALVLGAAAYQWRQRHPYHRPGLRFTSPAARRLERSLRRAHQPLDSERLAVALRALAAGLADRDAAPPDVVGAMVDEGTVHLLLSAPCPDPPTPWQDHGDRWSLVAGADLPVTDGPLSPLPTLTAVGSQAGIHLLLDLERVGVLSLHGEPTRARELLRYLAAELSCNTWSDQVEVMLAGFESAEAELLAAVNPDRVHILPSVTEAIRLTRRRVASARATLRHTGAGDALTGRVRGLAGDAWMPQVLLVADPTAAELAELAELSRELSEVGRCAVAVATTGVLRGVPGARLVTVTPDGAIHLRLPWVRAVLCAAALSTSELSDLAATMREARTAPPRPVPPAAETEPWATGTDAAGALIRPADEAASLGEVDDSLGPSIGGGHFFFPPDDAPAYQHAAPVDGPPDPDLDSDLRDWYSDDPGRPRIGVLGPILVNAPGVPPESRRRLHAEMVVFLAQRGARGADAALLTSSLWPDAQVTDAALQRIIGRARRWLGTSAAGEPWLCDVDGSLTYRLAEGYLFDWHLFRRLRTRAETKGFLGEPDLRAALELVRGTPLDGADRPSAPGSRNPYPWLADSEIHPPHLLATVVDTAHHLAELCLARGDLDGVRWAVRQAWYVDVERGYDHPWRDLLRAEYAAGNTAEVRRLVAELMRLRDAEVPEDLAPDTYGLIRDWPLFAHQR